MPDASEFEEKEYEWYLYAELVESPADLWPPGQVLEGHIGFDAAAMIRRRLWRFIGRRRPGGALLQDFLTRLPRRSRLALGLRQAPAFAANVFIQSKRPFSYRRYPPLVAGARMTLPCWYFDVYVSQHRTLATLQAACGNRADVTYASGAFTDRRELLRLSRTAGVVSHSTFPSVTTLSGHSRWAYNRPGAAGTGLSIPEAHDGPGLESRLARLRSAAVNAASGASAVANLDRVAELLRGSVADLGLADELNFLVGGVLGEVAPVGAVRSFLVASLSAELLGLTWLVAA